MNPNCTRSLDINEMHSIVAGEVKHCLSGLFFLAATQIVWGILTSGTMAFINSNAHTAALSPAMHKYLFLNEKQSY